MLGSLWKSLLSEKGVSVVCLVGNQTFQVLKELRAIWSFLPLVYSSKSITNSVLYLCAHVVAYYKYRGQ